MKNILFINTYYYPNGKGGAEKSTKILAESFAKRGFKVSVITTSNKNYSTTINNVDIYYINMGNLYWLPHSKNQSNFMKILWHFIDSYGLNNTREFERTINKINPEIVITNNLVQFSCKVWKIISNKNIPIMHIIRDHYLINMSTTISNKQSIFSKYITGKLLSIRKKNLSSHVNVVIGISNYILQKHLENNYFKNAIIQSVIPNALQSNENKKTKEITNNDRKPIFGYVGALNSRKGVDLVLDLFQTKLNNQLLLFGTGTSSYIKKLLKISDQFSNIQYIGYEKTENIFQKIDCLIVPSIINEAFGRVIIEAYSYGIPVIGSNRGGIPELIEENKTGFLFDPDIKDSLFLTIKNNSLDEYIDVKLKKYALEKSKLYSNDIIAEQYQTLLSHFNNIYGINKFEL